MGTSGTQILVDRQGQVESRTLDTTRFNCIPQFHPDEIILGPVIGRGAFCVVSELYGLRLLRQEGDKDCDDDVVTDKTSKYSLRYNHGTGIMTKTEQEDIHQQQLSLREQLARDVRSEVIDLDTDNSSINKTTTTNDRSNRKYVVKQVDTTLSNNTRLSRKTIERDGNTNISKNKDHLLLRQGAIDLVVEMRYLASLNHPNIVSIRGICSTDPSEVCEYANNNNDNNDNDDNEMTIRSKYFELNNSYFVILQRLPEILTHRLEFWIQSYQTTKGIHRFLPRGRSRTKNLLVERLMVAYDIAEGLHYLHSQNIIYRDLKPDNIGFDSDGVVKIFDFGLARDVSSVDKNEDGLYNLTGLTGALRYMAPEVGLHQPYNFKADMYSWAMLFWYIMALEPPLRYLTSPCMIIDHIFIDGNRPPIDSQWPRSFTELLENAWHKNIHRRYDSKQIIQVLQGILQD